MKVHEITVTGKSYYVHPSGSDLEPGTINNPFKTIKKAVSLAEAGETIYIRGGTYNERVVLQRSGLPKQPITIRNYPDEIAIIDGTGLTWTGSSTLWGGLIDTNEKSHFNLIGLTIQNSPAFGIGRAYRSNPQKTSHVLVENCIVYNTLAAGISFISGEDIAIEHNIVDNACNTTISNQECLSLSRIDRFTIKHNIVCNGTTPPAPVGKGGEMINVKDGCKNGVVAYNTVFNYRKLGIFLDAYQSTQENIEVYRNVVYQLTPQLTNGIAIGCERGGLLRNINLHHNIVCNTQWGFIIAGWGGGGYKHTMEDIYILNNTCYNINTAGIYHTNPDCLNVTIRNNILHGRNSWTFPLYAVGGANLAGISMSYNLLHKDYVMPAKEPYYITGTDYKVTTDPGFLDPPFDFHLRADSAAVNAGRTQAGAVCNIGAF
ncbi:MAG: right-handed parallel beta-helix repeat-containing protein [Thermincola sp.]|jgi:hypothetical protein|nr:right-handed parallel beta-helix repeat-containing protein [Thermincola sp.]